MFCDTAFTSIKLFRKLHQRGIAAVGPINAQKPNKGGNANSWPHQKYKKGDVEYLPRGWDRTAYSKMNNGGWIQATVRRDNEFVKLLNTCYIVDGVEYVTRWVKAAGSYASIPTRLVLKMYQRHMGHVDRCDTNVALCGIGLRHCSRRYHRQIFMWFLASIGFNNVLVLFLILFPLAAELAKAQDKGGFGFKHWFHLIRRGMERAQRDWNIKVATVIQRTYRKYRQKLTQMAIVIQRTYHIHRRSNSVTSTSSDTTSSSCRRREIRVRYIRVKANRGRGRSSKRKHNIAGRRHKKSVTLTPTLTPNRRCVPVPTGLEAERLKSLSYMSTPPFVPRHAGRPRKRIPSQSVFVKGKKTHTSTH